MCDFLLVLGAFDLQSHLLLKQRLFQILDGLRQFLLVSGAFAHQRVMCLALNVGQRLTEELHIFSEVAGALTLVTQRLLGRAKFRFCSIAAPLGCFTSAFRLQQLVAQLRGNGSRVFGNRARPAGA